MTDFLSYIGGLFMFLCSTVGAYIILRWGYCGIEIIWRNRKLLDQDVRDKLEDIITR